MWLPLFHVEHMAGERGCLVVPAAPCNSSDGGVDWPRGPGGGFGDEAMKDSLGGRADVVASLRMPLGSQDEVGDRSLGGNAALDRFNDCVLGATGRDTEAIARNSDGLVVAGVDGKAKKAVLFGYFWGCEQ